MEDEAFYDCYGLTCAAIPASVTFIGDNAFAACTSLTNFDIAAGNPNFSCLDGVLYDKAQTRFLQWPAGLSGTCHIPAGVTNIALDSFVESSGLTNFDVAPGNATYSSSSGLLLDKAQRSALLCPPGLSGTCTIPDGAGIIASRAFAACQALTQVEIPNSITNIGDSAFYNCTGLARALLPAGVTFLGDWAFYGCNGLTNIALPAGLTNINDYLFSSCSALTNVTLPGNVLRIGASAFENTPLAQLTLPSGLESIDDYAFRNCTALPDVVIPDSVTHLGASAFQGCSALTHVGIPASVGQINPATFSECTQLTNVIIPAGITRISERAFASCSTMDSITLPATVQALGDSAFAYCISLTNVSLQDGVASIADGAFSECFSLCRVAIPASVTNLGAAFFGCNNLTNIAVASANPAYSDSDGILFNKAHTCLLIYPAGRTNDAFTVPGGVTNIARYAFCNCFNLSSITLPSTVIRLEAAAFSSCSALTNVFLSGGLTDIGASAFAACNALTSLTLPAGVTNLGDSAFFSCTALTAIFMTGNAPAAGNNAIPNCATVYYLPNTSGWGGSLGGQPLMLWNPVIQGGSGGLGIRTNGFCFHVSGTAGIPIAVQACTNLAGGAWETIRVATLTGGALDVADSACNSHPSRYYRICAP